MRSGRGGRRKETRAGAPRRTAPRPAAAAPRTSSAAAARVLTPFPPARPSCWPGSRQPVWGPCVRRPPVCSTPFVNPPTTIQLFESCQIANASARSHWTPVHACQHSLLWLLPLAAFISRTQMIGPGNTFLLDSVPLARSLCPILRHTAAFLSDSFSTDTPYCRAAGRGWA